MYFNRKFGQPYQRELKRLSKELLIEKLTAQETFLHSFLQNEGRCWTEFYSNIYGLKGNREYILAIKDHNGTLITDTLEKANSLNPYYASLFSFEINNPEIQPTQLGKPFTVNINIIRKGLSTIGRKKQSDQMAFLEKF
jgi:hypothetical protein